MKPVCFIQKIGGQWVAFCGIGNDKRFLTSGTDKVTVMFAAKGHGYNVKVLNT